MRRLLFFILLIVLIPFCLAQNIPDPTSKYVNDFARVLDSSDATYIESLFRTIETETTAQVVFVSMVSINGSDLSQYATELGQTWGVGQGDADNGVGILYVVDVNKIWVATGYGVESILPDSVIGRMLDTYYVPLRDEGQISQGIVDFSEALAQTLEDHAEEIRSSTPRSKGISISTIIFFIILFIIILSIANKVRNRMLGIYPAFIPRGRSSGGFGGGGFGGGGFGGGGAGR